MIHQVETKKVVTVAVFEYLILITCSIDFEDFTSPFPP